MTEESNSREVTSSPPDTPLSEPTKLTPLEEIKAERILLDKSHEKLKAENDRIEGLKAEQMLGGTSGGNVEVKAVSPEEEKVKNAKDFWKGSALEDTIKKAHG